MEPRFFLPVVGGAGVCSLWQTCCPNCMRGARIWCVDVVQVWIFVDFSALSACLLLLSSSAFSERFGVEGDAFAVWQGFYLRLLNNVMSFLLGFGSF